MADHEEKALHYLAEAQKKLKKSKRSFLLFSSIFGGGRSKQEEACGLYVRAANAFKVAKNWPPLALNKSSLGSSNGTNKNSMPEVMAKVFKAGNAFEEAAQLQLALGNKKDAALHYLDAGTSYRKGNPNAAISAIHKAIEIYTDMGDFKIAANHHITLAEIYARKLSDIEKAIQNYEQAADYFKGEDSYGSANSCLEKVAKYSAKLKNYEKAIEIYEQVATSCTSKYSTIDYYFRASVCHMCMDTVNAQVAVKKYEEMLPAFAGSSECKLVKKLLKAVEDANMEKFTKSLDFDSVFSFFAEPFLRTLLLRVQKQLSAEPDLC